MNNSLHFHKGNVLISVLAFQLQNWCVLTHFKSGIGEILKGIVASCIEFSGGYIQL